MFSRSKGALGFVFREEQRRHVSTQALNRKLKSMNNIKKIVQTMKSVSAAKFFRAKNDLEAVRPYGQGARAFYDILGAPDPSADMKTLFVPITSDRGLSGGVNRHVASKLIKELTKSAHPESTKILCVGTKAKQLLEKKYSKNILGVVNEVGRKAPTFLDASILSNYVMSLEYKFSSGKIFYNESHTAQNYVTLDIPIYDLQTLKSIEKIVQYEMSDQLLGCYIEFSLAASFFFTFKEAAATEHGARVVAMDSATKMAGDLIKKVKLNLNKTRQATITTELSEIISGTMNIK